MSIFPGAIPPAGIAIPTDSLAVAGHTALHNAHSNEIRELATKMGTGSSIPAAGQVLRSGGAGVSAWGQVALTSDVIGILPAANGGTGQGSLTSLPLASPVISGAVSGGATYASPILTTPTITDYTNATHTHASNAQGGQLNGASAITDGTITPAELLAGTGSSWAWQSYASAWTASSVNPVIGNGTIDAKYIQIGKTVFFRVVITPGNTTTFGTGSYRVLLPVASAYTPIQLFMTVGWWGGFRGGVGNNGGACELVTTLHVGGLIHSITTAGQFSAELSNTLPGTWANGDTLWFQGTYEAA